MSGRNDMARKANRDLHDESTRQAWCEQRDSFVEEARKVTEETRQEISRSVKRELEKETA